MSDKTTIELPPHDPHDRLTTDLFSVAVFKFRRELPPPDIDDPDLIAQFVNEGIAQVASMVPVNAEEIGIAVRVVSAEAQASDCIRHARMRFNDTPAAMHCHAQANHYLRTANAARSLLLRVQSARHKREANPVTCNQDAWTIHATQGLLTAAAKAGPAQQPPEPPPPEPPPPPVPADDDKFARLTEAEQYAALYPRRAAEIRAYGGIPPTVTYGPPDPDLAAAVVASTSPMLQQIDREYAHTPTA